MDHFGLAVGSLAELEGVAERAKAFGEDDDRVDLIDLTTWTTRDPSRSTPLYVKYLPAHDVRAAVLGVSCRERPEAVCASACFVPQGWKLEYTGWSAARRLGPVGGAGARWPNSSGTTTSGLRPRGDGAPARTDPRLRGVHHAGGALPAHHHRPSWASSSPAPPTATPGFWPRRRLHRRLFGGVGSSSVSAPVGSVGSTKPTATRTRRP